MTPTPPPADLLPDDVTADGLTPLQYKLLNIGLGHVCDMPFIEATCKEASSEIQRLRRPAQPQPSGTEVMRDQRQTTVADWCAAAFGTDQAASIKQRGIRLLEEAIEAYQATGADAAMAHKMVDYIFARPAGTIAQELGGVGVTTLALANAAGVSADECEAKEVARVLAKPLAHFTARNQAKNDAGFTAAIDRPAREGEEIRVRTAIVNKALELRKTTVLELCEAKPALELARAALAAMRGGERG